LYCDYMLPFEYYFRKAVDWTLVLVLHKREKVDLSCRTRKSKIRAARRVSCT
jgi:hypothetical protein